MKFISLRQIPEFQSMNRQEKKEIRKAAYAIYKVRYHIVSFIQFVILIPLACYIRDDVVETHSNWVFTIVLFAGVLLLIPFVQGFIINPTIQQIINEMKPNQRLEPTQNRPQF